MRKNYQNISFFILAVLFLTLNCKTDLSKIAPPDDINKRPQLSITNFHAFYKMESELKAEAFAPIMDKYTVGNYVEFKEGVEVRFYDENFDTLTKLTCKYAINYLDDELWKFSGDVLVKSQEGGTLETQELYFNQKNEKIYSLKFVEVTDIQGNVIRGKGGFEADYNFTVYEFKNVDGILNLPKENLENF